jgi:branched-subunit amino acid transport protein
MIFIIILGLVNFLLRFLPAQILNKIALPEVVEEWLSFIPVATMSAIVIPVLLKTNNSLISFSWHNLNLLSAVPTVIVAAKTRNLGYTLATGMVTMAVLQNLV